VYNAPSRHMVVHFSHPGADSRHVRSLYYRDVVTGSTYTLVRGSNQDVDYDRPVSSPDSPHVFFLVWRASFDGESWGFNWESISRLTLPSAELTAIRTDLEIPDGYRRGWLSELLEVSRGGDQVTVIIGLEAFPRPGSVVDYYLSNVSLASGRIDRIAKLPTPFM
jgi:hypothetical protein